MTNDDEDPSETSLPSVGYGRPPLQHRFKKGQSGNPNGRRTEKRGLYHPLQEMLDARLPTKNDRMIAGDDAIAAKIIEGAMKGHAVSFRKFVDLARRANLFHDLSNVRKFESMNPEKDLRAEVQKLRAKLARYDAD